MLVPKLRFKEFNGEWKIARIYDLFYISAGGDIDKNNVSKEKTNLNNIPVYANSLENSGLYGYTNIYKVSGNTITVTGRGDIGYAIARNENYYPIVRLLVLKPKINLNNIFFAYAINNINLILESTGVPQLTAPQISKYFINYPKLKEQEKIANFLSLLDKKIKLQKQKIEALKIYKTGLIKRYFDCKNGKKVKIGEILEEFTQKTTENNQYDVISSTKDGLFLQKDYFNRSIASEDNSGYKILKKYQIVISPQNLWMGNINYNNKYEIGIVSPSYKVFNINKKFNKDYVSYLLKTNKAIYYYTINSEQGASIVRRNLNIESFYEINFIIPDIVEQEQKGKLINKISSKIENEENKYKMLNKFKKGLLQKMFI